MDSLVKNDALEYEFDLESRIYEVRGKQVIFDRDLAKIYNVESKRINEQRKRNSDRFPIDFCFQLTQIEVDSLRSQNATLKNGRGNHRKYLPYVFTEQGVAMLATVLKSKEAIQVSIVIIKVFVRMRQVLQNNGDVFLKLQDLDVRQKDQELRTEVRFKQVFNALETYGLPKQGVFFEGQVFDAHTFASDLIRSAKTSLLLIDNFVDDTVLTLLSKRNTNVSASIYTKKISNQLELDLQKHNEQYPGITIKQFSKSHDRFLIIDEKDVYHIGASLKDLGKSWFAFSKLDKGAMEMVIRLGVG
ncbi:MAG: ORF6N domain-containing protein [Fibrobacterales bacterium]